MAGASAPSDVPGGSGTTNDDGSTPPESPPNETDGVYSVTHVSRSEPSRYLSIKWQDSGHGSRKASVPHPAYVPLEAQISEGRHFGDLRFCACRPNPAAGYYESGAKCQVAGSYTAADELLDHRGAIDRRDQSNLCRGRRGRGQVHERRFSRSE